MSVHFHQYENATLTDKRLSGTTRTLYDFMLAHSHINSHDFCMSIRQLAEGISRAMITARFHLNKLIAMGFVTRILQKDSFNPRWNKESRFIVHQIALVNSEDFGKHIVPPIEKSEVPPLENQEGKEEEERMRENKNLTINREAKTPLPDEYEKDRKRKAINLALKDVPDILRTTAEYLLQKTDRFHITQHELEVLRSLTDTHTPVRIQKEIDKCCQRFIRLNKNLRQLTFNYIGKCLENQRSLVRKKKPSETQPEAPVTTSEAEQVQECLMPLEEAQHVISDYVPMKQKLADKVTPETEEFYARLNEASGEKLRVYYEYLESLPRDEHGCYIFPQNENETPDFEITPEEYLKLKYPEAEEEELRADDIRDQIGLELAKNIDTGCATCKSPDTCCLPNGYKAGGTRPYAVLEGNGSKKKRLNIRYGGCIRCKYREHKQHDPEFEMRLKNSGLTALQAHQTFEEYEHTNVSPEIVIAKAQAILAVKNNTSLIISGKAGTGKTHLAVAIAIETMRQGKQALFRNVPEMLDDLRERAKNHDDFYYAMRKYKDVPCLVLDDLGKEKTTQAGLDYMYQIIDSRYRNGKQTIVTTNAQSIEGLKNRWNEDAIEPLISRLLENGTWVTIRDAENRRLKKRAVQKQELADEPEEKAIEEKATEEKAIPVTKPEVSGRVGEFRSLREILPETKEREQCHNLREILEYRRKHGEFPPEYEKLDTSDQFLLQRQLMAEYIAAKEKEVQEKEVQEKEVQVKEVQVRIPSRFEPDDGLDDDEEDLRLYGDTGIPGRRCNLC